jgi:hypothetical protein
MNIENLLELLSYTYTLTRYIVYKIVEVTQDISNDLGHQLLRLKKKVSTIHHSK